MSSPITHQLKKLLPEFEESILSIEPSQLGYRIVIKTQDVQVRISEILQKTLHTRYTSFCNYLSQPPYRLEVYHPETKQRFEALLAGTLRECDIVTAADETDSKSTTSEKSEKLVGEKDIPENPLLPQPPQKKPKIEPVVTLYDAITIDDVWTTAVEIQTKSVRPKPLANRLEALKQFLPDFKDDILKLEDGEDSEFVGKITVKEGKADDLGVQLQICLDDDGAAIYSEMNTVYITSKKLLNRLSIHLDKLV